MCALVTEMVSRKIHSVILFAVLLICQMRTLSAIARFPLRSKRPSAPVTSQVRVSMNVDSKVV